MQVPDSLLERHRAFWTRAEVSQPLLTVVSPTPLAPLQIPTLAAAPGRIRKSAARALGGTNPAEFPLTIRTEKGPALNGHRGAAEGTTGGINQGSESNPPGRTYLRCSIRACPKPEHETSRAPVICRARS